MLNLKSKTLFGIYALYGVRQIKRPIFRELLACLVLSVVLVYSVSLPSILANMFHSPSFYRYLLIAFSNTNLMVQLILVLVLGIAVKAVLEASHLSSVGRVRLS